MSLPELEWQIIYASIAWTVVITALIVALLPKAWRLSGTALALILAGVAGLEALPGEASPSYWLGLAFQMPSGFLAGLCFASLHQASQPRPEGAAMPLALAALIALASAALYLDAIGILAFGFYYAGFAPVGVPVMAVILAVACAIAAVRGQGRAYAVALLGAISVFAVLRLPTGNLWDALLDPFLVAWAFGSLGSRAWRRWTAYRKQVRHWPAGDAVPAQP